jgi:hypothetical protein
MFLKNKTKLKVAVAIYGIPRGAELTYPSIMECIVNEAKLLGDVSLYGHLFSIKNVINSRSNERGTLQQSDFDKFSEFNPIIEEPNQCLELYDFEKILGYGDIYEDDSQSLRNLVHQLHSLKMVTKRLQQDSPDVVIFIRPDLFYHNNFPQWTIKSAAKNPNRCFLPTWQWWWGYNDRMAVCGRDAYLSFGERIDKVVEYCEMNMKPLHAERLLKYSLGCGDVKVRRLAVRASRVRVGNIMVREDFKWPTSMGSRDRLKEMVKVTALALLRL